MSNPPLNQLTNKPQAILFDLDGTLLDSAPDLAAATNLLLTARQLPALPYAVLRPHASAGARGLVGTAFGIKPGDAEYAALRDEFLNNYEQAMNVHSRLFDGVEELLHSLGQAGIAWGIVTNKLARFTDVLVPQVGLGHAACIISGDTTGFAKPHPAPLLAAASALQVPAQACWYVGDDARDIEAGRAAGMATIAANWGYCEPAEVAHWGADHSLQEVRDILRLLAIN